MELAKTETAAGRTHLVTGIYFIGFRKRNDLNVISVVLQFTLHGSAVSCTREASSTSTCLVNQFFLPPITGVPNVEVSVLLGYKAGSLGHLGPVDHRF